MCVMKGEVECDANKECFDFTKRSHPILRCRACRFQKCLVVGMNPLALELDDSDMKAPNYQKFTVRPQEQNIVKIIKTVDDKLKEVVNLLAYLEMKVDDFRHCSFNPNTKEITGLQELLTTGNIISLVDRYGPMPGWPVTNNVPMVDFSNSDLGKFPTNAKHWMFFDLLTTIEYAKTFPFFQKLSLDDQLILLKGVTMSCTNLMISHFAINKKADAILNPDGTFTRVKVASMVSTGALAIAPLIRFQVTSTEYVLLKTVCLCNPTVWGLSDYAQLIISQERNTYANVLFDHCRRTRTDGIAHFAELIGILDILERQQRKQKDLHLLYVAPFVNKFPQFRCPLIRDIMRS